VVDDVFAATVVGLPLLDLEAEAAGGVTFAMGLPFAAVAAVAAPLIAAAAIPLGALEAGLPFAGTGEGFPDALAEALAAGAGFFALLGLVDLAIATNVSFQVRIAVFRHREPAPATALDAPQPKCLHAPLHTEKATFPLALKTLRLTDTPTVLPALAGKDVQV